MLPALIAAAALAAAAPAPTPRTADPGVIVLTLPLSDVQLIMNAVYDRPMREAERPMRHLREQVGAWENALKIQAATGAGMSDAEKKAAGFVAPGQAAPTPAKK